MHKRDGCRRDGVSPSYFLCGSEDASAPNLNLRKNPSRSADGIGADAAPLPQNDGETPSRLQKKSRLKNQSRFLF